MPDVEPQGYPENKPAFQNNVGKTGQIFNPAHPYFADVDSQTAEQLHKIAKKEAGILLTYQKYKTPNGNEYEVHSTHTGEELIKNKAIAEFLVDNYGGQLKLLPNNIADKKVYKKIMPIGVKEGKHPDALWKNEIWEFKTNKTGKLSTLKNEINEARKQADNIIIKFDFDFDKHEIYRLVKGQILATKSLQRVWILNKNRRYKFEREYLTKQKPQKN